jgi:hypothetical protein
MKACEKEEEIEEKSREQRKREIAEREREKGRERPERGHRKVTSKTSNQRRTKSLASLSAPQSISSRAQSV